MKNTLNKLRIEGNFLNLIKRMHKKHIANIKFNVETLDAFPFRSETRGK